MSTILYKWRQGKYSDEDIAYWNKQCYTNEPIPVPLYAPLLTMNNARRHSFNRAMIVKFANETIRPIHCYLPPLYHMMN